MARIKLIFTILLFGVSVVHSGEMQLLSFYTANRTDEVPIINGTLDDPCWENAGIHSTYYTYNKLPPEFGALKTEMRMLWGDQGLYLGIVNYDNKMAAIRTNYTTRDNTKLWLDDCAEIYFDPSANGIGFTKFTVNAIGTVSDMRRVDAAVLLAEWSASSVEIATSQREDGWVIEAFFPWSDLGSIPESATIWRFCHVRYAWSSGKFAGVSSSPGGSYTTPQNFGFVYFSSGENLGIEEIGQVLLGRAARPWSLPINNGLLVCDGGDPEFSKMEDLYNKQYSEAKKLLQEIKLVADGALDADFEKVRQRFALLELSPGEEVNMTKLKDVRDFVTEMDEVYWKRKLNGLLNKGVN